MVDSDNGNSESDSIAEKTEHIYLNVADRNSENGHVKVEIFFKSTPAEHIQGLKQFLKNQKIKIFEFSSHQWKKKKESGHFSHGFAMEFFSTRWSFFKMRVYIQNYHHTWAADTGFFREYLKEFDRLGKELHFDEQFYLKISNLIDKAEDSYYLGNRSISLFINSVLHIIYNGLHLEWSAAFLKNVETGKMDYFNYVSNDVKRAQLKKILGAGNDDNILKFPVVFRSEHIADFFIRPGINSPSREIMTEFMRYVLKQIDDFIYGDRLSRSETWVLKQQIRELEQQRLEAVINSNFPANSSPSVLPPASGQAKDDAVHYKIILIGAHEMNNERILSLFAKLGLDKKKVTLKTDYDKLKSLDINNLKKMRSKYDGILLGPMPHKMSGDLPAGSLIALMQNNPDDYPPFVVIKDKRGKLKISKKSLEESAAQLIDKLDNISYYNFH